MIDWKGSLTTQVCYCQVKLWFSNIVSCSQTWHRLYFTTLTLLCSKDYTQPRSKTSFNIVFFYFYSWLCFVCLIQGVWHSHKPISWPKTHSWFWKILHWHCWSDQASSSACNRYIYFFFGQFKSLESVFVVGLGCGRLFSAIQKEDSWHLSVSCPSFLEAPLFLTFFCPLHRGSDRC